MARFGAGTEWLSISKIVRRLSASRNAIAKYMHGEVTKPKYKKRAKRAPVMRTSGGKARGDAGG